MYDKHILMEHIRKKNSFLFSFLIWFNVTQNNVDNTLYYFKINEAFQQLIVNIYFCF